MAKRALIFILLILSVSAGVVQAQEGEFLGIDAGSYTPGSWITMRWRVSNVDMAILEIYDLAQPDAPTEIYTGLPTEAVHAVFLPDTLVSGVRVVLWSADLPDFSTPVTMYAHLRSQTLLLPVTTPVPVASPTPVMSATPVVAGACLPMSDPNQDDSLCLPMREGTVKAAYQPFENGFMLWRSDSGEVWVLEKSGAVVRYPETVYGLMPDNPISDAPPTGRSAPINGFGKVWGNVEDVRNVVGWALGSEVSYTMTVHYAAEPFVSPYVFMSLPDDKLVNIVRGGRWTFDIPQ